MNTQEASLSTSKIIPVLAMAAGIAVALSVFYLTRGPLFGKEPVLPVMGMLLGSTLASFSILMALPKLLRKEVSDGLALMGVAVPFAFFACLVTMTDLASSNATAWSANNTIDVAQDNMGRQPAIAGTVRQAAGTLESTRKNREFLRAIQAADTRPEAVVSYLTAARALGLSTQFVADNGMVRPDDQKDLFQAALAADPDRVTTAQEAVDSYRALAAK